MCPNFTYGHWAELFHNNVPSGWTSFWKFPWSEILGHFATRDRTPGQTFKPGQSRPNRDVRGGWSHFFRPQLHSCSKFLNPDPGPAIFQIWETDSCSDSGYSHRSNRNLPMFLLNSTPALRYDHTDSCYSHNWKVTPVPGPVLPKFFTPVRVRKKNTKSCQSRLRVRSVTFLFCYLGQFLESTG